MSNGLFDQDAAVLAALVGETHHLFLIRLSPVRLRRSNVFVGSYCLCERSGAVYAGVEGRCDVVSKKVWRQSRVYIHSWWQLGPSGEWCPNLEREQQAIVTMNRGVKVKDEADDVVSQKPQEIVIVKGEPLIWS
jgi:hypothetical protein